MIGQSPAKYLLCRKIPSQLQPSQVSEEELWTEHARLSRNLSELVRNVGNVTVDGWALGDQSPNLLDIKCELVERMLRHCDFCEWDCRVNRAEGKIGFCRLDKTTRVCSCFHHYGEEAPLIGVNGRGGSGTIFFESCTARCVYCLHPDTYVITQKGPIAISQLFAAAAPAVEHEGVLVRFPRRVYTFGADGRAVKITKIFKHEHNGLMISIKPLYGPPIIATPEHELLGADGPGGSLVKFRAEQHSIGKWVAIPRPNFIEHSGSIDIAATIEQPARQLSYTNSRRDRLPLIRQVIALSNSGKSSSEIGRRLGYHASHVRTIRSIVRKQGFPKATIQNRLLLENGRVRLKNEKKPGIYSKVDMNEEFAELLGYYCSEGNTTKTAHRPSSYHIVLSFGRHEERLAKRASELLRQLFDVKPYITKKKTTVTVEITKTSLALLLTALCGTRAASKKVPSFLFQAPRPIVEAFLRAYEAGDGCVTGIHLSLNTVSRDLAFGLYGLYLKLGHLPSFRACHPPSHTFIEGRRVKQSALYYVKVSIQRMAEKSWKSAKHVRYSFADDHILVPIFRIRRRRYSGPVFNLEVEDQNHTYTANYLAIGNCQNWDISQPKSRGGMTGEVTTPLRLAEIAERLARAGAGNINYVGGEPTPNLHTIVNSLQHMTTSVPLIWNSNMYCSMETMKILADLIDLWLPDFKFWRDECARRLMLVGAKTSYPEVVRRNHLFAAGHGSMIIRHLIMPRHVECCSKPILHFISETIGDRVLVNIMAQYHPDNLVTRNPEKYAEIARRPSREEIQEAYAHARALRIQFEQVS